MFKVYANQIPSSLIDSCLASHEYFKKSYFAAFRAQGSTKFEKPILDQLRNQKNSIHNPHLLGISKSFSANIESIILHPNISSCLSDFTEHSKHVWYQSMFFDKSTATKLHQDTWYLDTDPPGKLVGVWIALEDIEQSAGPFCIFSSPPTKPLKPDEFDFDNLENDVRYKSSYPNSTRYDFKANKGDILIWDSLSIHGALVAKDKSLTRKSITAHFYPDGANVQAPPVSRFFGIYDHKNPIKTSNSNIKKATVINPYVYQSICLFMAEFPIIKQIIMKEKDTTEEERKITNIRNL